MPDKAPIPTSRLNTGQRIGVGMVWIYRVTLGALMGGHCRFQPTCSQYAIDAITQHGAIAGTWKAIKRIARCHPLGGRGYDPA
ncbi:MAG: membrane protein insertion efficiency factor YidD [Burkholderiales bacterium]|nr:membrane protein insertion efficiency factor YidD [Phycisphaerae bacterium]